MVWCGVVEYWERGVRRKIVPAGDSGNAKAPHHTTLSYLYRLVQVVRRYILESYRMNPTPRLQLFQHLHRLKTLEIDEAMIQQQILEINVKIENRNLLFSKKASEREAMEHSYEITLLQCEIEVLRCKERRARARFEMENVEHNNNISQEDSGQRLKKLAQSLATMPPESP